MTANESSVSFGDDANVLELDLELVVRAVQPPEGSCTGDHRTAHFKGRLSWYVNYISI